MSTEVTAKTMNAYLDMLTKRGAYGQFFTDDVTFSLMGPGLVVKGSQAVEQFIRSLHEQSFDADPQLQTLLNGDGQAALEALFRGKHIGEFMGLPATGRSVEVPYSVFYELQGDKIKALRGYLPVDAIMGQLNAAEPQAV